MGSFSYRQASSEQDASRAARSHNTALVAGGTDFLPLWRAGVLEPDTVVDIDRLPLNQITLHADVLEIGALCRMSDVADHPLVRNNFPAVTQALLASASPQVRNRATMGGNLLQRTRCAYFRNGASSCNKRAPGSGCSALHGENRLHAAFGGSDHCVATHASDLAVALVAADARVRLRGPNGERQVLLDDFYLLPEKHPERETVLVPGELMVAIDIPVSLFARRSRYLKIRDRASFEFAVVSVAASLEAGPSQIRCTRLVAGGVGTKPWRLRASEQSLQGAALEAKSFRLAADKAADGARTLRHNAFKLELLRRAVFRALSEL